MYIYYFPAMTGFTLGDNAVEQLMALPNLVGLKFTDTDFYVLRNLIDLSGASCTSCRVLTSYASRRRLWERAARSGRPTTGWRRCLSICTTRTTPAIGATAAANQARANAFIRIIHRYEKIAGQKVIMDFLGVPCGPTRAPIRTLDDAERARLRAELDAAGFADVHAR
ncbi:MAG: hypothetical protein M5U09_03670 [Gammaproteobacteria bacterium]|nr:hypothetical protein [Gammaproteobacteria bacterium]